MPTDVLIVNIAVLFAVLEADLGRRKISTFRILRPVFLAAGIIPLFIVHPAAAGTVKRSKSRWASWARCSVSSQQPD